MFDHLNCIGVLCTSCQQISIWISILWKTSSSNIGCKEFAQDNTADKLYPSATLLSDSKKQRSVSLFTRMGLMALQGFFCFFRRKTSYFCCFQHKLRSGVLGSSYCFSRKLVWKFLAKLYIENLVTIVPFPKADSYAPRFHLFYLYSIYGFLKYYCFHLILVRCELCSGVFNLVFSNWMDIS